MKKLTGIAIVLVLCAGLLYGCGAAGVTDTKKDYSRGGDTISGKVENLDIDWTAGSVTVAYHAEDTVILSESADREIPDDEKLLWKLDGTTLKVEYHKTELFKITTLAKNLTITLPENTRLNKAEIRATSADLKIPSLRAEEAILETTSGNTDAAVEAKNVKASSTSGDVVLKLTGKQDSVDLGGTSGDLRLNAEEVMKAKAHSTSGSITVEAKVFGSITAESTSGNVSAKAGGFTEMKLGATSGSVDAALPVTPGFAGTISTTSGEVSSRIPLEKNGSNYTCGDGSGKLTIGTTSGNVTLTPLE